MTIQPALGDKYRIDRRIGVGGMAEVFLATILGAEGFERRVVLKRILPQFSGDPKFQSYFIGEAKTAAALDHENVVRVFDFFCADSELTLVMEYVDGCDLAQLMNLCFSADRRIPLPMALLIGRKLLRGLAYAHARAGEDGTPLGIVHRDITPRNVLLGRGGEVKVTDFGIARSKSLRGATQAGALRGKISYMSPEQAHGDLVDARSDVYSAALVIWELICGVRAFDAPDEIQLLELVRRPELPAVGSLRDDLPPGLEPVLERALAALRQERYADAGAFERALNKVINNAGLQPDEQRLAQFVCELLDEATPPPLSGRRTATLIGREISGALTPPRSKRPRRLTRPRSTARTAIALALVALIATLCYSLLRPDRPVATATVAAPQWIERAQAALLSVQTDPAGALVLINGAPLGLSPIDALPVLPGKSMMIEALKPGHLPGSRRANLVAGKNRSITIDLCAYGDSRFY